MSYTINRNTDIKHAIEIIYADYGDVVSLEAKNKDLLRFGRNTNIQTTKTTLMTLPSGIFNETYLTDNLITTVSSTAVGDAKSCILEGHTIAGGVFTFVAQTVVLNGQNQVTLTTPLARVTKIFNNDTTDLTGTIYVYQTVAATSGVPNNLALVHLMIDAGLNNSEKASTTISNTDYYVVRAFFCDCLEKTAIFGIVHLELRLAGKVFTNVIDVAANDTSNANHEFHPYLIIPKNSDIRLRVSASTNGRDFSGGFEGYLLKVI